MKTEIKISVIIPVYNVEQYLRECLDSIVNQTLKDIEIICVNDGSTDNSLAILEEYANKDGRIKIINKENGGPSAARNCAIALAQGEYIGFVDSDDWIDLDFYEKLYNTAKKYNADIACADLLRISTNKEVYFLKHNKVQVTSKVFKKYRLCGVPDNNYIMNRIYKTERLKESGILFEENILFEDILWSHKVLYYLKKLVTVPDTKYNYRDNPVSIVNTGSEKIKDNLYSEYRKALVFMLSKNIRIQKLKRYSWDERKEYKILGIPVLTIKKYYGITQFFLFGKLLFLEEKNNNRFKD